MSMRRIQQATKHWNSLKPYIDEGGDLHWKRKRVIAYYGQILMTGRLEISLEGESEHVKVLVTDLHVWRKPLSTFVTVTGTEGSLYANKHDGTVFNGGDSDYKDIQQIDVAEFKKYWNLGWMPDTVDICNVGYWDHDGKYESPAMDWRKELPYHG